MNKRDQVQQEAIRNLAKLSSNHDTGTGEPWVDPRKEGRERRRLSVELTSQQDDRPDESEDGGIANFAIFLLTLILCVTIFGYGFYGIIMAFLAS
ncbi:hypothetical protein EUZ85_15415 [Hahella sp. KA22]|uniref:hypothetical protein n=1 Tax=Hahella sp. KA22 TaxID=1628392 RepID=UPI000FDF614C|nr:hypothetical protein [Hahella sp. KA22]AZZ92047.1 hypothetical protein ENC22_12850 [Hahella sp. KA22]QAY55418.1 hypothetical protein EUZ85_15415 [Hahella sp. KA22]